MTGLALNLNKSRVNCEGLESGFTIHDLRERVDTYPKSSLKPPGRGGLFILSMLKARGGGGGGGLNRDGGLN